MSLKRSFLFLATVFMMSAPAWAEDGDYEDEGEAIDLLYPRLEKRGIIVRGHMKARIKILPGPCRVLASDLEGFLITADGPYWGLPPVAYFCDARITSSSFDEDLPTLCSKLPGIGWQVREMIRFRSTTARRTIAGDDYGILNLLTLTLYEHPTHDPLDDINQFEITEALGRFEIYGRPKANGERREMWTTMEEARNPLLRRGLCSRLISMVGLMTEKRQK